MSGEEEVDVTHNTDVGAQDLCIFAFFQMSPGSKVAVTSGEQLPKEHRGVGSFLGRSPSRKDRTATASFGASIAGSTCSISSAHSSDASRSDDGEEDAVRNFKRMTKEGRIFANYLLFRFQSIRLTRVHAW